MIDCFIYSTILVLQGLEVEIPNEIVKEKRCIDISSTMTADIAILGAGPSGLVLARILEVNNISYTVFERDESSNVVRQTGTLDIHDTSGQLALKEAGLLHQFEAIARYDAQRFSIIDKYGKDVCSFDNTDSKGRPEIDRKDLRDLLLKSIPAERIRWGHKVKRVERDGKDVVSIHFENGLIESGFKLVVGADGTWSKARELVISAKPLYSGITYLQALIGPKDDLYEYLVSKAGKGIYGAMGSGKQVLAQSLGDGTYNVYIGLRLPEDWVRPATDAQLIETLLRDEFSGWHPEVKNMLAKCKSFHAWRLWSLRPEDMAWQTVPGIALIGDAAHASTPFVGEGVNQAMTDSMELGREIVRRGIEHLTDAVAAYEKSMLPRAIDFIQRCEQSGKFMFAEDSPKGFREMLDSYANGDLLAH